MRAMSLQHSARHDSFAARLRAAREHARLTPAALAAVAKITPRRVCSLEMGGSTPPDPAQIGAMAAALSVPSLWLMAGGLAGAHLRPDWYSVGVQP